MTNYGWRCKHCGAFKNHNKKRKVRAFKESHTQVITRKWGMETGTVKIGCATIPTGRGTVARPELAHHIRREL